MHFINKHVNIGFISCVLKIFEETFFQRYQSYFLHIPKSQPDFVSNMFLNFFALKKTCITIN